MGYLILLSIGAALGWLAAIIFKEQNGRTILIDIAAGTIGAMIAGLAVNASTLMNELSASTFLYGCLGACASIAISKLVRRTLIDL